MNLQECEKKALVKKNDNAKNRVKGSLEIAEKFSDSALKNIEIEEFEMAIIAAYNSIFHSCRALLFRKGFTERSHYCLMIAVKELYKEDQKLLELLNSAEKTRISRHNIQYLGQTAGKEEAKFVLELAEELMKIAKEKALKNA